MAKVAAGANPYERSSAGVKRSSVPAPALRVAVARERRGQRSVRRQRPPHRACRPGRARARASVPARQRHRHAAPARLRAARTALCPSARAPPPGGEDRDGHALRHRCPHGSGTGTVLGSVARDGDGALSSARRPRRERGRGGSCCRSVLDNSGSGTDGGFVQRQGDPPAMRTGTALCPAPGRTRRGTGTGSLPASPGRRRTAPGKPAAGTALCPAPGRARSRHRCRHDSGRGHGARLDRLRRGRRSVRALAPPPTGHEPTGTCSRGWNPAPSQSPRPLP